MNNLEEDLKQASYAIKALLLQNKSLIKEINTKISENKNLSNELNLTIGENQNLKMKLENLNITERKMNEIMNNENNYNDLVNVNNNSWKYSGFIFPSKIRGSDLVIDKFISLF